MIDRLQRYFSLANVNFVLSFVLFAWVVWYCYTGFGGPQELVSRLLPIALAVQMLFMYRKEYFYKWLPPAVNHLLVLLYFAICIYAFV